MPGGSTYICTKLTMHIMHNYNNYVLPFKNILCSCRSVRFRDVRLVNRNHLPTLEDRTADLAHIFERRRAIMDSAIVRMLKREKEMSVDTIAVKVHVHVHGLSTK